MAVAAGCSSEGREPGLPTAGMYGRSSGGFLDRMDPIERGRQVHNNVGCAACHSLDGSELAGGTFRGIYGTEVELADGTTMLRDDAYLRIAIIDPEKRIVKGYDPIMMAYDMLIEAERDGVIELIRSLGPERELPHGQ